MFFDELPNAFFCFPLRRPVAEIVGGGGASKRPLPGTAKLAQSTDTAHMFVTLSWSGLIDFHNASICCFSDFRQVVLKVGRGLTAIRQTEDGPGRRGPA